jgi:tRNA-dihydrouridine synthase B
MGADIVDVNMGCPVPKIAKHNAGCSLMREPVHAAAIIRAMARAVRIPVTVKMRAGWDERARNAPELARRVEEAGAAAVTVHGRTAAQSYSGSADWAFIGQVAQSVSIPTFGSGDCIEPEDLVGRLRESGVSGVLVGRGALRNPWIFSQAVASSAGRRLEVGSEERGQFLLDYMDLQLRERVDEAEGFRHGAPGHTSVVPQETLPARGRERWVINKIRALASWYTKGVENGSRLRVAVNAAESVQELRGIITAFFFEPAGAARSPQLSAISPTDSTSSTISKS